MKKSKRRSFITMVTIMITLGVVSLGFAQQATSTTPSNAHATPSVKTTQVSPSPTPSFHGPTNNHFTPPAPEIDSTAYVLMDANSGKVLAQKDSGRILQPASLTKLMTIYVTFNAMKQGLIKPQDKVLISRKAWKTGGSKMFVKAGNKVPVEKLIEGAIVASGNDACIALAQYVGGSVSGFVAMMNQQARMLGMVHTHFSDPTGLPSPDHTTTAYDLAILTRALITQFPEQYHDFSKKWLTYNGIRQPNRNRLLWRYPEADGLKTGHTEAAGYCLIASAQHDGMRLISVVMGASSDEARTHDSITLLRYGFRFFNSYRLYSANTTLIKLPVWYGQAKSVSAGVAHDFVITIPHGQLSKIQLSLHAPVLTAPIRQGQKIGQIIVNSEGQSIASAPVVALETVQKGGLFRYVIDTVHHRLLGKKAMGDTPLTLPQATPPNPLVSQPTKHDEAASSIKATPHSHDTQKQSSS